MASSAPTPVPDNNVWLILIPQEDLSTSFYLQIPLGVIETLCSSPRKYLLFLGWCILGMEGVLAVEPNGGAIVTEGDLNNRGIYYFVTPEGADFSRAVGLEVIKTRSPVSSRSTNHRVNFHAQLAERDIGCVWTGGEEEDAVGMHIIPFQRGSDWIRLIAERRPHYGEDVTDLRDVNDVRNGMLTNPQIHGRFDRRTVVILKTPNPILSTDDIPQGPDREYIPPGANYPLGHRYTLQSLKIIPQHVLSVIPHNADAAFNESSNKQKPSALLLHYRYGAAAAKLWGHGIEVLKNRSQLPRPQPRAPMRLGPARGKNDRRIAIEKREQSRSGGSHGVGGAGGQRAGPSRVAAAGAGSLEAFESEGEESWDEDDVMLFFMLHSREAQESHLREVEENTRLVETWRATVSQDCT